MAFDQAIADSICAEIAAGTSVRQACEMHGQNRSELYKWLREVPTFADQYARAREECAETLANEILDIADDSRNDWIEREDKDGNKYVELHREAIERSRMRLDARKWLASKLLPKQYGDRIDVTGTSTQQVIVRHVLHTREPTPIELEPHDVKLIERK